MVAMSVATEVRRRTAATDPGHSRFITAIGVSAAVLMSAAWAWIVVHEWHGDSGLLAVGAFLAMQLGLTTAKGATARGRLLTTALAILPLAAAIGTATLLSRWRVIEIVVFVLVAGVATWIRRFGPRATALSMAAFFGYFFAVLQKPTPEELPGLFLVAAGAVCAQIIVRTLMLLQRPHRQITLAFQELRSASEAAIAAAVAAGKRRGDTERADEVLRQRLARITAIAQLIRDWQERFDTAHYVNCDAATLDGRVLDARIETEHACATIAEYLRGVADPAAGEQTLTPALRELRVMLSHRAKPEAVASAAHAAQAAVDASEPGSDEYAALGLIARSTLAHHRLREAETTDPTHRVIAAEATESAVPAETAVSANPSSAPEASAKQESWWHWKSWRPTSRMAAQVMVAASIATVVGELISASRWYWAVLTAFMVFVGTSTRADTLTRAFRRVWGTVLGILVGFPLVLLANDNQQLLTALCVIAVFCMLYFGPLQYGVRAFSITVMLVSMYGLLGVLNVKLAEVRIAETVAGAVIGVLCAYLVFSMSSRPSLAEKIDEYVGALGELLDVSRRVLTSGRDDAAVRGAMHKLDSAQETVDTFVSAMTMSFLRSGIGRANLAVHYMFSTTRAAGQLAQASITASSSDPPQLFAEDSTEVLDAAFDHVRNDLRGARGALGPVRQSDVAEVRGQTQTAQPSARQSSVIIDLLDELPYRKQSPQVAVMWSLSRLDWVLRQLAEEAVTDRDRGRRTRRPDPAQTAPESQS